MWPNPQETADLVTFTEEILNGKLYLLCSVSCKANAYRMLNLSLNYSVSVSKDPCDTEDFHIYRILPHF